MGTKALITPDHEQLGVPHIWVVDPWTKMPSERRQGAPLPVEAIALPDYAVAVHLQQLIEGLPL